jgi:hypothetical protein
MAVIGLVLLGVGVAVAVPWVGRLAGYETPGTVAAAAPVAGCPGEWAVGRLILGDTVQVVGVTEDGRHLALRDGRGPGNVVYVESAAVAGLTEPERLPMKVCQPREEPEILASPTTSTAVEVITTTNHDTVTTPALDTPTTTTPDTQVGRPPRRGMSGPGTVAGSAPTPSTTPPGSAVPPTTDPPGPTGTSQPPADVTTTTQPPATTTTTAQTTTTTEPTTTTTEASTTTTEPTTTTTEPETTTTIP